MNKVDRVLRRIEKMEKKWKYFLTEDESKTSSFGRIPLDRNKIELWSVPRTTGELLRSLILITKSKKILELGCSAGYSTIWMGLGAKEMKGRIYTTEIFPPKIKMAKKNFKDAGLDSVITLIEKDITDVLSTWNKGKVNFVFMDADKQNYLKYYNLIFPILKKGGFIVADNAVNYDYLMKPFLKKVKSDKRIISQTLDFDNGLLLIYKK